VISKEARTNKFKAMLVEAGVNAFSFYDKIRVKLEKDTR
jgi:hypothetical protein